MYVEDVKDGKGTCIHIFAHNFLNIQLIFNPQKVLESSDLGLLTIPLNTVYIKVCQRCQR